LLESGFVTEAVVLVITDPVSSIIPIGQGRKFFDRAGAVFLFKWRPHGGVKMPHRFVSGRCAETR
jgi:hypothetical protein